MELPDFFIGAITPPPNVQEMMDKRAGMAALGIKDMIEYAQYRAGIYGNISKQPAGAAVEVLWDRVSWRWVWDLLQV